MKSNDRRLYKRIIAILLVVLLILPQGISSIVAKAAEIEGLSVSMGTITKNTSTGNYNAAATITLAEGSDIDLSTAGYNATFYKGSAGSGTAITEAVSVNSENVTAQIKNDATISVDDTVYVVISDGTNESVSATAQAGVTFPEPTPEIDTTKPVEVSGNSITVYSDIQGTLNSCKIIKVSEDNSETVINGSINIEFDSSCKATITCDLSGYANENYKIKVTNSDGSKAAISALIRNNYVLKIAGDGFVVLDSNNNVIPNNTVITSSTTKNVTVKTTSEDTPLFSSLKTKIGDGDAQDVEATPSTTELSSSASVTLPNVGDFSEFTISGSVKPAELNRVSVTVGNGNVTTFYPGYRYSLSYTAEMLPICADVPESVSYDVSIDNTSEVELGNTNDYIFIKTTAKPTDASSTFNITVKATVNGIEKTGSTGNKSIDLSSTAPVYSVWKGSKDITPQNQGDIIYVRELGATIKYVFADSTSYNKYSLDKGSTWVDLDGKTGTVTMTETPTTITVRSYNSEAEQDSLDDMTETSKQFALDDNGPTISEIAYYKTTKDGDSLVADLESDSDAAISRKVTFKVADEKSGVDSIYYIKESDHSLFSNSPYEQDLSDQQKSVLRNVGNGSGEKNIIFTDDQDITNYYIIVFDNAGNYSEQLITIGKIGSLRINTDKTFKNGSTYEAYDGKDDHLMYIKNTVSTSFVLNGYYSADGDYSITVNGEESEEYTLSEKDENGRQDIIFDFNSSKNIDDGTYSIVVYGEDDTNKFSEKYQIIVDSVKPKVLFNDYIENNNIINRTVTTNEKIALMKEVSDDNIVETSIVVNVAKAIGDNGKDVVIDTDSLENLDQYASVTVNQGNYKITYSVKDKAGNETSVTKEFIYDVGTPEGSISSISADSKKKEYSDYQYFDNKTIKVSLKLSDSIAGISNIEVRQANVTIPSTISKTTSNKNGDYEKTAEFSIPVTYKGYLNVLITDKAGNTSTVKLNAKEFAGVIAENGSASNSISISATKIESKFDNGTQYYNKEDSPKVSFDALDEISGIYGVVLYGDGDTQKQKLNSKDGYYVKDKPIVTKDSDSWSFSTSANEEKEYTLKAVLEDNSENYIKSNEVKAIVDNIAPEISITYNGSSTPAETYNSDVNVVVTVKETYFKDGEVTIHDGSSTKTYNNFVSNGNGTATCSITLSDDSNDKYWVSAVARDMALNETKEDFTSQFILDKTSPRLTLTFNNNDVRNEKYYNAERIGTLTVEEHNFDASKVTVNVSVTDSAEGVGTPAVGGFSTSGDTHQASIPFTGDATYQITVTAEDQAGNAADQTITESFVVDLTDPEINISNVEEDKLYSGTVNPDIEVTDRNYDSAGTKITLVSSRNNGAAGKDLEDSYTASSIADGERFSYSNFKKEEDNDDYYVIKAVAEDLAGNTSEETIGFMVNRFGSYFTLNDYTSGIVDAIYTNLEGDEAIEIAAHNLADIDESTVYFTVGEDTQTLEENNGYTVSTKKGDDHWNVSTYTFDKSLFESEGEYNIVVSTKDSEGNVADNESKETPVKFVIDRTAPEYVINGVEDGQNYEDVDSVSGNIELHDNIGVAKAVVTIDGTASEYEGKDLDDMNYSIPVDFEKGSHTVKVKVYDVAGNESVDDDGISFSVNQSALERNLWWIIALIVAALAIGVIIFFVVKGRRDERA